MANNEIRTKLQSEALHDLCFKNRVILNWGTGVGKSKVAVDAFDRILARTPSARFLLVVQETAHKMNWKADITKHLGEQRTKEILKHTTVECYASLKNYRDTQWNLIVFDEAHHLRSEARLDILKSMSAARVLALSATINDQGDGEELLQTLTDTFGEFVVKRFDMIDAIDSGVLGEPEIHVVALKLNDWQQDSYDKLTASVDSAKERYKDKRQKENLESYDEETSVTKDFKDRWMYAAMRRKRYLGNIKASLVTHILDTKLRGKRLVCFCANVKQVEKIGGKDSINGEHTKKENLSVIENFNNDLTDRLFAVGMIQEGQNLNGIEAGVIAQLDGKSRSFIQRLGRVMRSDKPLIYIIFVPDTRDEEYLENALADFDPASGFVHFDNCEPTPRFRTAAPSPAATEGVHLPSVHVRWTLDKEGVFKAADAKGEIFSSTPSLEGQFVGIGRTMGRNGYFWYQFKFIDKYSDTLNLLEVHQKMSIGIVMQLASVKRPASVRFTAVCENGFPGVQVFSNDKPLQWVKRRLPAKQGTDDRERMQFIDSVVDEINASSGYSEDIF